MVVSHTRSPRGRSDARKTSRFDLRPRLSSIQISPSQLGPFNPTSQTELERPKARKRNQNKAVSYRACSSYDRSSLPRNSNTHHTRAAAGNKQCDATGALIPVERRIRYAHSISAASKRCTRKSHRAEILLPPRGGIDRPREIAQSKKNARLHPNSLPLLPRKLTLSRRTKNQGHDRHFMPRKHRHAKANL